MTVPRVGFGYDVHPVGGDGPLVLGGVEIEGPGLVGHSDADVVVHAVADAVLAAADLPELGVLFPAADARYAGVASLSLLAEVVDRVRQGRWRIGNVDVVVTVEAPKLAPHVTRMRERLTAVLAPVAHPDAAGPLVTVRPKYGEGVGAVGRGEAAAAWAVAVVVEN